MEYKTWSSPSLTNTSKIHLHVEQFLQNTNWNLAEDLLTTNAARKIHNWSERKTTKEESRWDVYLWRWSHERGQVPSPWEPLCHLWCPPGQSWSGLDSAVEEYACAGLLPGRADRDLCWWLSCHYISQPRIALTSEHSCWVLNLSRQTQGKDSVWLHGDGLKDLWCGTACLACTGQCPGPPQVPHYQDMKGLARVHHRSPLSVCSRWGTGPAAAGLGSTHMPEVVLTSQPSITAHTARMGLRVVQAAADYIGTHTGWWAALQNHTFLAESPGEESSIASFIVKALQSH